MRDVGTGRIVVHRGRAHTDDFLASCVCLHKTGLPLFRADADDSMLDDPSCWVLDQGMRHQPELLNFDHHQTDDEVCSLTMVLDHLYGPSYRDRIPQLRYIEIYDSHGSFKAAAFAGAPAEALEVASSLVQRFVLAAFSAIEGEVAGDFRSVMLRVGSELCGSIEGIPVAMESLDLHAKMVQALGLSVLDVTECRGYDLPTKDWCRSKGLFPAAVLARDPRTPGSLRLVAIDRSSVSFGEDPSCSFVHPSGFMAVFPESEDWRAVFSRGIVAGRLK